MCYACSQCCKCLRRKVVREVIYCHDDDAMYWPGQLFHKNKNGKYLDLSLRARFGRRMESARKFMEEWAKMHSLSVRCDGRIMCSLYTHCVVEHYGALKHYSTSIWTPWKGALLPVEGGLVVLDPFILYSLMKAAVGCRNVWITVSVFWLAQRIDRYESS